MSIVKVSTSFSKLRDEELDTRAQNIIDKMTGNPNYPTPVPALADLTASLTGYREAQALTLNGGKESTAVKNEKRKALESVLNALSLYVQVNCKGSLPILLSSGFEAHKQQPLPSPVSVLDKPENFKVEHAPNPGSILLSTNKVEGAVSYVFEYAMVTAGDPIQWIALPVKVRNYRIEGLTSGKQYAFRVAGVGAATTLIYSDVITRYVQ